ncbi:hypothetical protein [Thermosulfurimonas sp. F29]|uniref:hypothetical protein n=1 Tax=Thermosulfurimonas sp. F29 TaxID=2867247 RepID=UPI001C83D566|nr:hypothetical protein [Thermosulfurimonas sp. F29]MBX6424119.1 hypothetical protein [Thermosulfurimonas sp. F29]
MAEEHKSKVAKLVAKADKAGALATAALTALGPAVQGLAGVYIVPPDIDQYKQKTDQAFYDLYQNPNSAVAKGARRIDAPTDPGGTTLRNVVDAMPTDQRLLDGYTIPDVVQTTLDSAQAPAIGQSWTFRIGNYSYRVWVDQVGRVHISGPGARNDIVQLTGNLAIPASRSRCVASSKYGCVRFSRVASEVYYNPSTGVFTIALGDQTGTRSCSKYGCSPIRWQAVSNVRRVINDKVSLADAARGRLNRTLSRQASLVRAMVYPSHMSTGINTGIGKYG